MAIGLGIAFPLESARKRLGISGRPTNRDSVPPAREVNMKIKPRRRWRDRGQAFEGAEMPENSGCTPGGEFKVTDVRVQALSISQIKLDGHNSRTHSAKQIRQIANSIIAFGFTNPLLVNEDRKLIAGEGRLKAAQLLDFAKVPAIVLTGLSPARQRAPRDC
jgi:hypothetical protein